MRNAGGPGSSAFFVYAAAGCGRDYNCEYNEKPSNRSTCTETPESEANSLRRLVVNRLALETGCPERDIAVVKEAEWTRSRESAYRLQACGKPYVCSTAPGATTTCRAALSQ